MTLLEQCFGLRVEFVPSFDFINHVFPLQSVRKSLGPLHRSRMLCSTCSSIFRRHPPGNPPHRAQHHSTPEELSRAATSGCRICILIQKRLERDGVDLSIDHRGRFLGCTVQDEGSAYRFIIHPGDYGYKLWHQEESEPFIFYVMWICSNEKGRSECFDIDEKDTSKRAPADSGDVGVAGLAQYWLTECLNTHYPSCPTLQAEDAHHFFPDRLVDISCEQPRLLLTHVEKPSYPEYATLSHCWGSKPDFFTLTESNIDELCKRVPVTRLSKTFQDAILTAQRLGIFYIWIDSLCIIQSGKGSHEDWQKQSTAMESIYANSILNISADRASIGSDGLFIMRDPSKISPISFRWGARVVKVVDDDFVRQLITAPLWKRGWVVQERMLSPRVLHFGADQVFWECRHVRFASETFPLGLPSRALPVLEEIPFDVSTRPTWGEEGEDITSLWHRVLERYTRASLSRPSADKFVAIGAIAERIAQLNNDEYYAGFLSRDLPRALLWEVDQDGLTTGTPSTHEYRAPTWSWANIDGPVKWSDHWADEAISAVRDIRVNLVSEENKYGQIKAARILLDGCIFEAMIEKPKFEEDRHGYGLDIDGKRPRSTHLRFDTGQGPDDSITVYFLLISYWAHFYYGLIVKEVGDGTFCRLGSFSADFGRPAIYTLRRQLITLV
jgi:hypothetical protein